jgi:hypothetical protein
MIMMMMVMMIMMVMMMMTMVVSVEQRPGWTEHVSKSRKHMECKNIVVYILVEIAQKILEAKHELIKVSKHFKTRTAIS